MSYWRFSRRYLKNILLLFFLVSSCQKEPQPATFYPIDSLISAQVRHLTDIRAALFKEASLGGKADTLTYVPGDTVAWLNELGIFRELDVINKPVNKGNYRVDDGLPDPGSNLTIKAFTSLKKMPVVYLKIYYQGTLAKPRKIEALYDEVNALYESSRLLSMHFEQVDDETVLTRYSVIGGQQIIFGDSVAFHITGRVLID